jgi:hypothetical protein
MLSADDLIALHRAENALAQGDVMIARRHLAALENTDVGDEIGAVIRAGLYDDAALRLDRFLNPKFPSVTACAEHVGKAKHFDSQGENQS